MAKMIENADKYKLEGLPKCLWINLERSHERRSYMEKQFVEWGISDQLRIAAIDALNDDLKAHVSGEFPPNLIPSEVACVVSHLEAIKFFFYESDLDEVLILEDDVDFSLAKYWTFTWKEVRERLPINWDTCQFTIINPMAIMIKLHQRYINDFSAACYLISRRHAAKLMKLHEDKGRWRLNLNILPRASSENLVLDSGKGYAIPLFTYRMDLGSFIREEHLEKFHRRSSEALIKTWKERGSTFTIDHLMALEAVAGRLPKMPQAAGAPPDSLFK
jgi:hypothetical protein